jgi:hypothetical protein
MKKTIYCFCFSFLSLTIISHAQNLNDYLLNRGAKKMASFAHPSNTFAPGNSSVTPYDDYFLLDLYYTDVNSNGYLIHTKMKLGTGAGSLYFNSIKTIEDNDGFPTFGALVLGMSVMLEAAKENNPEEYNKTLRQMQDYLGVEPESWNGADWALFLINFDYGCRCVGDD